MISLGLDSYVSSVLGYLLFLCLSLWESLDTKTNSLLLNQMGLPKHEHVATITRIFLDFFGTQTVGKRDKQDNDIRRERVWLDLINHRRACPTRPQTQFRIYFIVGLAITEVGSVGDMERLFVVALPQLCYWWRG